MFCEGLCVGSLRLFKLFSIEIKYYYSFYWTIYFFNATLLESGVPVHFIEKKCFNKYKEHACSTGYYYNNIIKYTSVYCLFIMHDAFNCTLCTRTHHI